MAQSVNYKSNARPCTQGTLGYCTARGATHSNVHGALVHEAEAGGGVAGSDEDGGEDERRQDESQAPEGAVLGTVVAVVVTMPPHHLMRLRVWLGLRLWVRARVRLGGGGGCVRWRGWGATSPARALARARTLVGYVSHLERLQHCNLGRVERWREPRRWGHPRRRRWLGWTAAFTAALAAAAAGAELEPCGLAGGKAAEAA